MVQNSKYDLSIETNDLQVKFQNLKEYLRSLGNVVIAFSGGVDSTFLLKIAHDVLGDKAIAVTARSCSFPKRELNEASAFAAANGIEHIVVDSEELSIEGFSKNPVNRCYLCKKELFSKIEQIAGAKGISNIAEGSNMDDNGDYRPGLQAVAELHVKSPLRQAGLAKKEIRQLSKEIGLPTWNKQSFACLSSRFPYGENITPEKLQMIDKAEQFLLDLGFRQVRVRHHGDLARIEVGEEEFDKILQPSLRGRIHSRLKEIGFTYVSVDLKGYRTGSMNETLDKQIIETAAGR
ncbi:MAG: hypothetical protein K0Q85_544 [Caproiciproducens sp.]|nr:hypothetical protein [Caproiciproducens sp.]